MAHTITGVQTHQTSNGTAAVESTRQTAAQSSAVKAASVTQEAPQRADQASVSSVGALVAKASEGSDVRTEKVAALQQAISSGTYHVPASAVAGKIVDSLLS